MQNKNFAWKFLTSILFCRTVMEDSDKTGDNEGGSGAGQVPGGEAGGGEGGGKEKYG